MGGKQLITSKDKHHCESQAQDIIFLSIDHNCVGITDFLDKRQDNCWRKETHLDHIHTWPC